jgi:hypothetical protein
MELNMEGGCTCRQVRFRLVGTPLIVHACHCRWCQRETGTAHALNALYEADRVVHTAGEPEVVWTPSESGKGQKCGRGDRLGELIGTGNRFAWRETIVSYRKGKFDAVRRPSLPLSPVCSS